MSLKIRDGIYSTLAKTGGGSQGIGQALSAEIIEAKTGHPIHKSAHRFDGLSVGSIGVAILGELSDGTALATGSEYVDLYKDSIGYAFETASGKPYLYENAGLREILDSELGDKLLSDYRNVYIHVSCLGDQGFTLQTLSSEEAGKNGNPDYSMADVVMGATFIPGYFPMPHITNTAGEKVRLFDAALSGWTKDQTYRAYEEARQAYPDHEHVLLTLSTGHYENIDLSLIEDDQEREAIAKITAQVKKADQKAREALKGNYNRVEGDISALNGRMLVLGEEFTRVVVPLAERIVYHPDNIKAIDDALKNIHGEVAWPLTAPSRQTAPSEEAPELLKTG